MLVTRTEYCERCDGCGWHEGGSTIQTECEVCKGTGVVRTEKEVESFDCPDCKSHVEKQGHKDSPLCLSTQRKRLIEGMFKIRKLVFRKETCDAREVMKLVCEYSGQYDEPKDYDYENQSR